MCIAGLGFQIIPKQSLPSAGKPTPVCRTVNSELSESFPFKFKVGISLLGN